MADWDDNGDEHLTLQRVAVWRGGSPVTAMLSRMQSLAP
jgi:hypothetical protein